MTSVKKEIKKLNEKIEELNVLIKKNEIVKVKKENEDLRFIAEQVKHIKMKVKDVKIVEDPMTGKKQLKILYSVPVVSVELDDFNQIVEDNPIFKAINYLDCISYEDMNKINKTLEK